MELSNQEVKLPDNHKSFARNDFQHKLAVNAFMAQFGLMLWIFQFVTPIIQNVIAFELSLKNGTPSSEKELKITEIIGN